MILKGVENIHIFLIFGHILEEKNQTIFFVPLRNHSWPYGPWWYLKIMMNFQGISWALLLNTHSILTLISWQKNVHENLSKLAFFVTNWICHNFSATSGAWLQWGPSQRSFWYHKSHFCQANENQMRTILQVFGPLRGPPARCWAIFNFSLHPSVFLGVWVGSGKH